MDRIRGLQSHTLINVRVTHFASHLLLLALHKTLFSCKVMLRDNNQEETYRHGWWCGCRGLLKRGLFDSKPGYLHVLSALPFSAPVMCRTHSQFHKLQTKRKSRCAWRIYIYIILLLLLFSYIWRNAEK
jgi:hypothetical protein